MLVRFTVGQAIVGQAAPRQETVGLVNLEKGSVRKGTVGQLSVGQVTVQLNICFY
jgi:hypothetical protein